MKPKTFHPAESDGLLREKLQQLQRNISKVLIGKEEEIKTALVGLLAQGHLLIEDVPGVGKTTLARALAKSVACSFQRIQFTPDLLPSDILGVSIYHPQKEQFEFKGGPIFAHIILAD
ncbi:MAG: AAA family ATPase, partial [Candidatus Tectomicrobia bacterium]|nr:AAA family ATPase [Candidatus Tectomicrobia bacterium]